MRPSLTPGTVSSWASSSWYWESAELRKALGEMLSVADHFANLPAGNAAANYRHDLVDIMRQCLADLGRNFLLSSTGTQESTKKVVGQDSGASRFLQLILDQDRLLGTLPEFRLGSWTEAARGLGTSVAEKDLYEKNARMLLTTWGDRDQCESGGLHDYANREWNGLLASYYYPRWRAFFDKGCVAQQWFEDYEWPFATGTKGAIKAYLPDAAPFAYGTFRAEPQGDPIAVVRELYEKYLK